MSDLTSENNDNTVKNKGSVFSGIAIVVVSGVIVFSAWGIKESGVMSFEKNETTNVEEVSRAVKEVDLNNFSDTDSSRSEIVETVNALYKDFAYYTLSGTDEKILESLGDEANNSMFPVTNYVENVLNKNLSSSEQSKLELISQLSEDEVGFIIEITSHFIPPRVDINYDSLSNPQKALTGIVLGDMLLAPKNNSTVFRQDDVIAEVDSNGIVFGGNYAIVPSTIVSLNNNYDYPIAPLKIVHTQYGGFVVDFFPTAKIIDDNFHQNIIVDSDESKKLLSVE